MYEDSFRKRYGLAPVAISSTENHELTHPHIHNEIELLVILQGTARIKIAHSLYDVKPGDVLVVNPLEIHSVKPCRDAPYVHRCICFDCSLIVDRKLTADLQTGRRSIPNWFCGDASVTARLRDLFENLFEAVEANPKTLLYDCGAYVSLLFSHLVEKNLLTEKYQGSKARSFYYRVITYLAEHYSEAITSAEAAEALFYTQSYFCRAFKKCFGVRFSEYLNTYRLLAAKEKLQTESVKIADVAMTCGFNSAAYFTKCFKKSFGMTPLTYRKSQYSYKI